MTGRMPILTAAILTGAIVVAAAVGWCVLMSARPDSATSASRSGASRADPTAGSAGTGFSAAAHRSRSNAEAIDERPFAQVRADLERRALAGDAVAARRLGTVLANCNRFVPMTDEQLENWVVSASANDISVEVRGRALSPEVLLARMKLGVAQKNRECRNVANLNEPDAAAKALGWLERAAALGDADAQALYGSVAFTPYDARSALADAEGVRERRQRAADYLQTSLAHGDSLALEQLSEHYAFGALFPANAETAYAYLYAFSLTPRAADLVPELLQEMLSERSAQLDAAALTRARIEGQRLSRCCMADAGGGT